jgi:hypothetical protein
LRIILAFSRGFHGGARAAKASGLQIYKNVTDDTIDFTQLFVYICVAFKNSHFFNGLKLAYNSAFSNSTWKYIFKKCRPNFLTFKLQQSLIIFNY